MGQDERPKSSGALNLVRDSKPPGRETWLAFPAISKEFFVKGNEPKSSPLFLFICERLDVCAVVRRPRAGSASTSRERPS